MRTLSITCSINGVYLLYSVRSISHMYSDHIWIEANMVRGKYKGNFYGFHNSSCLYNNKGSYYCLFHSWIKTNGYALFYHIDLYPWLLGQHWPWTLLWKTLVIEMFTFCTWAWKHTIVCIQFMFHNYLTQQSLIFLPLNCWCERVTVTVA